MRNMILFIGIALLLAVATTSVSAQTAYTPYVYSTPVYQRIYDQTYLTNMAVNQMMRSNITRASGNVSGSSNLDRAALLAKWKKLYAETSGPTQFKPTKEMTITDEEILKMFNGDKEKAEEFDKVANQTIDTYSAKVLFTGAPTHDVASVLAYSTTILYKVGHNYLQTENPDSYVVDNFLNLVNQLRAAMIAEGKVPKLKPIDKGRMFVMNLAVAGLIHKRYQEAVEANNLQAIKDTQMLSRKMVEDLAGAPFDKVIINKNGLSIKK